MSFSVEDKLAGKVHLDPKSLEILIHVRNSHRFDAGLSILKPKTWDLPANRIGPLSMLPPKPAFSQNGGAQ